MVTVLNLLTARMVSSAESTKVARFALEPLGYSEESRPSLVLATPMRTPSATKPKRRESQ